MSDQRERCIFGKLKAGHENFFNDNLIKYEEYVYPTSDITT